MTESCQQIQLPPLSSLMSSSASGMRHRQQQQRHVLPLPNIREHDHQPLRVFSPVILFHDYSCTSPINHRISQPPTTTTQVQRPATKPVHLHPYNSSNPYAQMKKSKISEMLEGDGSRIWHDTGRKGAFWNVLDPHFQHQQPPSSSITTTQQQGERPGFRHSNHSSSLPLTPPSHDGYHFKSGYFADTPADDNSCSSSSSSSSNSSAVGDDQAVQDLGSHVVGFHEFPTASTSSTQCYHPQQHVSEQVVASNVDNRKRRGNLPKPVTAIMKRWLVENCTNPYPTEDEKDWLKQETGLTLNQISNWFINARRRILPMILAKAAALEGTPVMHHKKRRGKPPSAITAARRKMASKRTCQKLFMDDDHDWWLSSTTTTAKRGLKRSSSEQDDGYDCMRPSTRARHH